MTIIFAYRNTMYADSRCTVGSTSFPGKKLFPIDGCILGIAGDTRLGNSFMEQLRSGWAPQYDVPPYEKDKTEDRDEFEALLLRPWGDLWHYDTSFAGTKVDGLHMAVGTGSDIALGALEVMKQRPFGIEPIQIIRAVCKVNIYCGLPVQWMSLDEPRAFHKEW